MAELYTVRIAVRRRRVDPQTRERPGFDFEVEGAADGFAPALRKHMDAAALPMAEHFDQVESGLAAPPNPLPHNFERCMDRDRAVHVCQACGALDEELGDVGNNCAGYQGEGVSGRCGHCRATGRSIAFRAHRRRVCWECKTVTHETGSR